MKLNPFDHMATILKPAMDSEGYRITQPVWDALQSQLAERDKTIQDLQSSSKEKFDEFGGGEEHDPLERLRFFCSLAMNNKDWIEVEHFFNYLEAHIANRDQMIREQQKQIDIITADRDVCAHAIDDEVVALKQTILEQQARISELRYWLEQMQKCAEEDHKGLLGTDSALHIQDNLLVLESALKAERIKTLEDAANTFIPQHKNDIMFVYQVRDELRRMANELKDQS